MYLQYSGMHDTLLLLKFQLLFSELLVGQHKSDYRTFQSFLKPLKTVLKSDLFFVGLKKNQKEHLQLKQVIKLFNYREVFVNCLTGSCSYLCGTSYPFSSHHYYPWYIHFVPFRTSLTCVVPVNVLIHVVPILFM
jgi:hypothetical protein